MNAPSPRYGLPDHASAELSGNKPPRYRQVMRDLSLSFYAAQGNEKLQPKWEGAAATYYVATWPEEDLEQLPQVIASVDATIAAMQEVPANAGAAEEHPRHPYTPVTYPWRTSVYGPSIRS